MEATSQCDCAATRPRRRDGPHRCEPRAGFGEVRSEELILRGARFAVGEGQHHRAEIADGFDGRGAESRSADASASGLHPPTCSRARTTARFVDDGDTAFARVLLDVARAFLRTKNGTRCINFRPPASHCGGAVLPRPAPPRRCAALRFGRGFGEAALAARSEGLDQVVFEAQHLRVLTRSPMWLAPS